MIEQLILCIGGVCQDIKFKPINSLILGSSNPVQKIGSVGGVAHNVAINLAKLDCQVALISPIGSDEPGQHISQQLNSLGIQFSDQFIIEEQSTAHYHAVLHETGELLVALADMTIFDVDSEQWMKYIRPALANASMVVMDCNPPDEVIHQVIELCHHHQIPLAIDPVSSAKCLKLQSSLHHIDYLFLNKLEAKFLLNNHESSIYSATDLCHQLLLRGVKHVILTLGKKGLLYGDANTIVHHPAITTETIDVSGAGDALIAATLAGLCHHHSIHTACQFGIAAASITINTHQTCNTLLSFKEILKLLAKENHVKHNI